jgi:hypothetical protein
MLLKREKSKYRGCAAGSEKEPEERRKVEGVRCKEGKGRRLKA